MNYGGTLVKRLFQNEKGLTLVEILAAVVILGIVLVSVMTFFTQSAKFTASNHDTLTAVQVGEEVVSRVRGIHSLVELTEGPEKFNGNVNEVSSDILYSDFDINVKREGNLVASKLQKVIITVQSKNKADKPNSVFKTEMYIEVQP